jgi:hydroxypyruvate reductase
LIHNIGQLIDHGYCAASANDRALVLPAIEAALAAADPGRAVLDLVRYENGILVAGSFVFDLAAFDRVYVIGAGKASGTMAAALESVLGARICCGAINVPKGLACNLKYIEVCHAGHPLPDMAGVEGTARICSIAGAAKEKDLIICLVSGGGSSLMPLPLSGISLADKQSVSQALLRSGAAIDEINTVRKHLSGIKGGRLAEMAFPATMLNLVLSDVVGDPLDIIASGPTVADSSCWHDVCRVLDRYELWQSLPASVRALIDKGIRQLQPETPKPGNRVFDRVHNLVVGNNRSAVSAAVSRLRASGIAALQLTSLLQGDVRAAAGFFAALIREIRISGNPLPAPAAIVLAARLLSGSRQWQGGRAQEMALALAELLPDLNGITFAAFGTDGIDGTTDAAGAIIDSATQQKITALRINAADFLERNDSGNFFALLQDQIRTGYTGTNVNDVFIALVR